MDNIKVSVIIPVCNVGKYLRDCLDSVVNQTLRDVEIICVDDFSSDGSDEILREYASADSRIVTIFHSSNLGTSQARKDGVAASRGRYVMFLDGDDFLAPNACEIALDAIVKTPVDMVQFGTNVINLGGVTEKRIDLVRRLLKPYSGVLKNADLLHACFVEKKFRFHLWNKIYDGELCRKAFSSVEDGYFPKAQDMYAFFVIASFAKSYAGIEDVLYNYNFGVGVTGGDAPTLGQFKALCAEHDVYKAVRRFATAHLETRTYNEIMERKDRTLFDECVNMCLTDLRKEDVPDGFQKLAETWGATDVICALAEKGWYDTTDLAEELQDVSFFKHVKRPAGKKLTIAAYYSRIRNGGAERVVAQSCNLWSSMKDAEGEPLYRVILITDGAPEKDEYPLDENVERAFLPPFRQSQKKNYRARAEAWEKILSEFSIDVVVYSMWILQISFWDMLCVKGHKTKPAFLFHSHGFCGTPFGYIDYTAFDHAMQYRFSDGVVVLSECDERYISAFCPDAKYIPNMQTFSVNDTPLSNREKNTLLWCSRISREQKRPFDVVRMMEYVVREIPDAKLYIVGDGSKKLTVELKNLVAKLHLEKNIIFEGFKTDVAPYYRKASVFVGTSSFESFWLTLGEALAHGVPIVAYELPWLTFMQDGRGIITVPQKRYDLLAKEVISLLHDPERAQKIGEEGRAQAEALEAVDIGAKWKEMFDNIGVAAPPALHPNEKILYEWLCRFQHEVRNDSPRGLAGAIAFISRKIKEKIQRL